MDIIIANKDYEMTKKFIEDTTTKSYLTESIKQRFIECYQTLTVDNAKPIYTELHKLNEDCIGRHHWEHTKGFLQLSGYTALFGVGLFGLSRLIKCFVKPTNKYYGYIDNMQNVSAYVLIIAFCMVMSAGH